MTKQTCDAEHMPFPCWSLVTSFRGLGRVTARLLKGPYGLFVLFQAKTHKARI